MKLLKKAIVYTALCSSVVFADMRETVTKIGEEGFKGYFGTPVVTIIGTGMNSGWHISSKPYSFLGMPFGVSIGTINIPIMKLDNSLQVFDWRGSLPLQALIGDQVPAILADSLPTSIDVILKDVPTFLGSDEQPVYTYRELLASNPESEGNKLLEVLINGNSDVNLDDSVTIPIQGIGNTLEDFPFIPAFPVLGNQINVGISSIPVIENATLGFRMLPSFDQDGVEFSYWGFSLLHDYSYLLPVPENLHLGGQFAYTNMGLTVPKVDLDIDSWILMATASYDLSFFIGAGVYGGLGIEGTNMGVVIDPVEIKDSQGKIIAETDKITLEILGDNLFRMQMGARVSLPPFDIYYDYNLGSNTIHNFGLTLIGLNGL
jgi:opacity protein-like surface antigen